MRFLNIFLILSAISSFSCQTKQKVRELSEPQELVSNDERKKQPERPDYAIKAPDFELRTIKGDIVKLSDLKGKVVLLNFWGTWCGPCRREIPDFIKLYDEYNDDGLEIIGVAVQSGTAENIKRFSDYYKINYTILTDIDSYESAKAFYDYGRVTGVGTRAVPTTFLIDRDGYIVKTYRGARPGKVFYNDLQPYL